MPIGLNPYLNFDGKAAEAMRRYGEVFGAEPQIMKFSDAPMPPPPGAGDRVMHAALQVGATMLMASDTMPGMPFTPGNSVYVSIAFADPAEQTRVFDALAQGGTVEMPLADQFWGRFGMLTDRFGVHWMLNHEPKKG